MTTDPFGQYHSPYLAMGNDPVNSIDPTGGIGLDCIFWAIGGALYEALPYIISNAANISSAFISVTAQSVTAGLTGGIEPPHPSKANGMGNQRLGRTKPQNNFQRSVNVDNIIDEEIKKTKTQINDKVKDLVSINNSMKKTRIFERGLQRNIDNGLMGDDPSSGYTLGSEIYRQYDLKQIQKLSKDSIIIRGEVIHLMKKLKFLQNLGQLDPPPNLTPKLEIKLPSKF